MDSHIASQLLEAAVRAPSGHNTQPWQFAVDTQSITICPDFRYALPVVDPHHRELFISLGCAAENLCITADSLGFAPTVNVTPEGHICVALGARGTPLAAPLLAYIPLRQTNRNRYSGSIGDDTLAKLRSLPLEPNTTLRCYRNGSAEYESITELVLQGNRLQLSDPHFVQELHTWIRINRTEVNAHHDGLSYATFGAPSLPAWISRPIFRRSVTVSKQCKRDKALLSSSSHIALLCTSDDAPRGWIELGRSLQRFLLHATSLGLAHAYLNQPNELPVVSKQMVEALQLGSGIPCILLRLGYAKPIAHSPRRSIASVTVATPSQCES